MNAQTRPPRARPNAHTRNPRRAPSRGPGPQQRDDGSSLNVTIEDARAGGSPAGVGAWCEVVLTSLLFAGIAVGALVLRPRRIELVHTETRGSATGRLFRVGRWTEAQGWIGRSRYVLEIIEGARRNYLQYARYSGVLASRPRRKFRREATRWVPPRAASA